MNLGRSSTRGLTFFLLSILAMAGVVSDANAQKITASLGGTVRDSSQAVVTGATVHAQNAATGIVATTTTNKAGLYEFPNLAPGSYDLTIDARGFKQTRRSGIVLQVAQSATVDFTMVVGSAAETIQVSGAEPLLETQESDVGVVIDSHSIVNLPLNQRNPFSLILLVPGVTGAVGSNFTGMEFNVNGGRAGTSEVLLDGVPSAPPGDVGNVLTIFPSVDAIQEFKVMTSNYSAQFGLSGSGIINVLYKSGGNQFHGDVYEFLRNSKMDSNLFFSKAVYPIIPLPHSERSQFGATLGGPVLIPKLFNGKNKFFFFGDYEGLRAGTATNLTAHVPTIAERGGDFSSDYNAAGALIKIYDPTTSAATSPYARTQFSCDGQLNVICPARFDPVGKAVMAYFPQPNQSGNVFDNYVAAGSTPSTINQWDVKLDGNLSDRQHLEFRYSVRNPTYGTASLFPASVAIAQNSATTTEDAIEGELEYTFARNSKDLYEFRYGIDHLYYRVATLADGFNPTSLGFQPYLAADALQYSPEGLTFPGFEMQSGDVSLGDGNELSKGSVGYLVQTFMLDNMRVLHRQTITYGTEFRNFANNGNQVGRDTGDFDFSEVATQDGSTSSTTAGDSMASLLIGLGSKGTVTHNFKIVDTIARYWAAFVQDDWRPTNNFTVNLGLRYSISFPRTERHNRMTWWDPTLPTGSNAAFNPASASNAYLAGLKGGLEYPGVNGNPRTQSDTAYNNWAPRVGFAFHPVKNIAIQAGLGVFYQINSSAAAVTVDNAGYRADSTYYGTVGNNGITPLNYLSNPFPGSANPPVAGGTAFTPVTGNTLGSYTNTGSAVAAPIRRSPTPYSTNYNLGVQYQLPQNWLVEARYVGTNGRQLLYNPGGLNQDPDSYLNNVGVPQNLPGETCAPNCTLISTVTNPMAGALEVDGADDNATIAENYLLSPFPQFTSVQIVSDDGAESNYNSIQLEVDKKFSQKLTLLMSYTGSKLMGDTPSNTTNDTPSSQQTETEQDATIPLKQDLYGVSNDDVSRMLTISSIYELPFGRGQHFGAHWSHFMNAIFGGYQVNGIFTANTGTPISMSASNNAHLLNPGERPNWNGQNAKFGGKVESRLGGVGQKKYFNTADFSQPATYTFGNMSGTSGYLRNPGYRNIDFSLFKTFNLKRAKLEMRAEAFNLFNTPEFGPPNSNVSSSSFGQITSQINSPRQIQVAAKIIF